MTTARLTFSRYVRMLMLALSLVASAPALASTESGDNVGQGVSNEVWYTFEKQWAGYAALATAPGATESDRKRVIELMQKELDVLSSDQKISLINSLQTTLDQLDKDTDKAYGRLRKVAYGTLFLSYLMIRGNKRRVSVPNLNLVILYGFLALAGGTFVASREYDEQIAPNIVAMKNLLSNERMSLINRARVDREN